MTNEAVRRLQVGQERQRADLRMAEAVNAELLRRVAALEHGRDNPIMIPDSPEALPVRPPFVLGPGSVLIPIDNNVNNERNQMTLGAKGHLPSGYIVSLLWVLKQFTRQIPTRQMVGSFEKYPPQYPVGTL